MRLELVEPRLEAGTPLEMCVWCLAGADGVCRTVEWRHARYAVSRGSWDTTHSWSQPTHWSAVDVVHGEFAVDVVHGEFAVDVAHGEFAVDVAYAEFAVDVHAEFAVDVVHGEFEGK